MEVIRGKTAMLFEASTHSAAALAGATAEQSEALRTFGDHLGVAFQLVDDLLDYKGDAETLGKNVGDDLAEGKPTLPLIYTMREGTAEQAALVRQAIQKGGIEDLESIRIAVEASGSLEYTAQLARDYVARAIKCLEALPASEYRDALVELSEFAVARTH
jgi:octaprenyl-diphosphate synthase